MHIFLVAEFCTQSKPIDVVLSAGCASWSHRFSQCFFSPQASVSLRALRAPPLLVDPLFLGRDLRRRLLHRCGRRVGAGRRALQVRE